MNDIINQFVAAVALLQKNLPFVLLLMGGLYVIHFVNWMIGYRLHYLGVYPRKISGLPGIIFMPFIHGDFNHLFFNSIPLFVLLSFVLLQGLPVFICVTVFIIVLSDTAIWLFARPAYHIGASGLIMGYWSYLLLTSYQHITPVSIGLGIVCIYYFGSLLFSLFPKAKTSFEAHVFGFLAGIAAVYFCPILLPYLGFIAGIS